jgi:hypothetical protein
MAPSARPSRGPDDLPAADPPTHKLTADDGDVEQPDSRSYLVGVVRAILRGGRRSERHEVLNRDHQIVSFGGFKAVATLNGSRTLEASSGDPVGAVDFGMW